jgi:putative transposase
LVSILESGERKVVTMGRKRFTSEQVIGMLKEAEIRLSQGEKAKGISSSLGITEHTYYCWRKDYGGRFRRPALSKEHGRENGRLKKAAAELCP